MTTLFDFASPSANVTYFDDLDRGTTTSYFQFGGVVLGLTGGAEQVAPALYDQLLDVELRFYAGAAQELALPAGPQGYAQSGNAQVILIGGGAQEHIPALAGIFGQAATITIGLGPNSLQVYQAGAPPGQTVQQAAAVIILGAAAGQAHQTAAAAASGSATVPTVPAFRSLAWNAPVVVTQVAGASIAAVRLRLDSDSAVFLGGAGPNGGVVGVDVALEQPGGPLSIVSLTAEHPEAFFYSGMPNPAAFDALKAAVETGGVSVRLGGYEALAGRSRPLALAGSSVLTLEATT